ncbi:MAG: hypothetical protein AAB381_02310 [Patescibacteria group bacterium]
MKNLLQSVLVGLMSFVPLAHSGDIIIESPNGGEVIRRNQNLEIFWLNPVPLVNAIFVDRYEDGVVVETSEIPHYVHPRPEEGRMGISVQASYYLHHPGTYKVRIIGTHNSFNVSDESDMTFTVIDDGVVICNPTDTGWARGESQEFTVSWSMMPTGRQYRVYLFNVSEWVGEGYGFVLYEGTTTTESGSLTFTSPYPSTNMSAYPAWELSTPVSGMYRAFVLDLADYGRTWSEDEIFLSAEDVFISATPRPAFTIKEGTDDWYLKLNVDASFSSADVRSLSIPLNVWIEDPDTVLVVTLEDDSGRRVSLPKIVRFASLYSEFTLATLPRRFTLAQGQSEKLFVVVKVFRGEGKFDIGLNTLGEGSAIGFKRRPLSSHYVHQWGYGATIVSRRPVRK